MLKKRFGDFNKELCTELINLYIERKVIKTN